MLGFQCCRVIPTAYRIVSQKTDRHWTLTLLKKISSVSAVSMSTVYMWSLERRWEKNSFGRAITNRPICFLFKNEHHFREQAQATKVLKCFSIHKAAFVLVDGCLLGECQVILHCSGQLSSVLNHRKSIPTLVKMRDRSYAFRLIVSKSPLACGADKLRLNHSCENLPSSYRLQKCARIRCSVWAGGIVGLAAL